MEARAAGRAALHGGGLLIGALMLLPAAWLVVRAFELGLGPDLQQVVAWSTLGVVARSLLLAGGVAALSVALALPLAWLTQATDLPGRRFFRVALNLPLAVPSYVAGFAVIGALGPAGFAGWLPRAVGLHEIYGGPGAVLALMFCYPLALLPMQAALVRLDPSLWEAARSLGRGPWGAFGQVVLPALRPSMAAGGLLVALYVLGDFGAVSLLRFESLSYVIYLRYQSLFDRGEAVWLGLILAALAVGLLWLQRRLRGRGATWASRGGARAWPVVPLGRWRWPAFALCAAVFAVFVVAPAAVVTGWLVVGLQQGNPVGPLAWDTLSTLQVGAMAAALTVGLALVPALIARYGHRRLGRVVHGASHVGYALPGIVVALALAFFAIRFGGALYQTLTMLLLAYVVRFLPLALAAVEEGMAAQSPRLMEAARSLGLGPALAWYRAVLPGLWPALAAALLVVFVAVIKELPATLLLAPIGFRTLATRIWSLTEDAFFTAAAPPVLVLLLLATLALLLGPDLRRRAEPRTRGTP